MITEHPFNNVTDSIFQKIGVNLHQQPGHPIGMIKGAIYDFFDTKHPDAFKKFDNLQPLVTAPAVSLSRENQPAGRPASLLCICRRGQAEKTPLLPYLTCTCTCVSLPATATALQNFDEVLVPADHVSRSPNDTYYVSPDVVLRCHTSAHQTEILRQGHSAFLVTGDVYRWVAVQLEQGSPHLL